MNRSSKNITVPSYIHAILDEYESKAEDFHEFELSGALDEAAKAHKPLSDGHRRGYMAESWAFFFDHSEPGKISEWGTHFRPVMSGQRKDGTVVYNPDLREVDAATIAYWEQRRDQVQHPVMRARYADLLWDFRKHVTGDRAKVEDARMAIDAYVDAIQQATPEYAIDNIHRLMRALELAISISDADRVKVVRDAMFTLYDKIVDPVMGGSWPWLFDMLYANKKVSLTDEQRKHMIDSMEEVLKRCTNPNEKESFSPWFAESAAQRLAAHYSKENRPDDVRRVIRTCGESFVHWSRIANGGVSIVWLQKVHDVYRQYGMLTEAAQVAKLGKEKGEKAAGQMARVGVTMQIDKAKLDAAVQELVANGLEQALASCALTFVPSKSEAVGLLKEIEKAAPFMSYVGISVLSEQQITAQVGSIREDLDGRIVRQVSETIDLSGLFLGAALDGIVRAFQPTPATLMDHISQGALIDPSRRALIEAGLEAYLAGDHVKVVHVLVPQIEHCLRVLLGQLGQATNKPVRGMSGIMQEKSLTDILEYEPAIPAFFKHFNIEDWHLYLRVYLTDRRGHHLRNRLAHGLIGPNEFSRQLSDRVFHILLLLAMIGKKDRSGEGDSSGSSEETQA